MDVLIDKLAKRSVPYDLSRRRRYPLRALLYALANRLKRDRRFEFELFHLDHGDPWSVRSSAYEADKFRRVMDRVRRYRPRAGSVLELGCSIGLFTEMLAGEFERVTAVDISAEALRLTRQQVGDARNVHLARADLQRLALGKRFDVIVAAEVLYLMPQSAVPGVVEALVQHMAPDGVLVLVAPPPRERQSAEFYDGWSTDLSAAGFRRIVRKLIDAGSRPYVIEVLSAPVSQQAVVK